MLRKSEYRDVEKWRKTKRKQQNRYYAQTSTGKGMPRWSSNEDYIVLRHEKPDREIAKQIGRSVAAIQKRRHDLKNKIVVYLEKYLTQRLGFKVSILIGETENGNKTILELKNEMLQHKVEELQQTVKELERRIEELTKNHENL